MTFRDLTRDAALRIPRVRAFYAHVQQLAAERDALASQREAMELTVKAAQARERDLLFRVDALEARERALRQTLTVEHDVRQGLVRERDDLRRGLDDALREITYQKAERERLSEALAGIERQLDEVLGRTGDDEREGVESLVAKLEGVQTALADKSSRYDELELKLYVTTSDFQRAVVMNDRLLSELREANDSVMELQSTKARFEQARDQAEAALAATRASLIASQDEMAVLREQVARAEEELAVASRNASSFQELGAQLQDARDRLAARFELLAYDLSDLRRNVSAREGQASSDQARRLYLDLLESALTGELTRDGNMSPWGGAQYDSERRLYGRDWPQSATTMIGVARMRNLRRLTENALVEGVEGDLLEAGVWRGGACIYMRGILAAYGELGRTVWVADSFAGLPPPDAERYPADSGDAHHTFTDLVVPLDAVKKNFEQFGLLDHQVAFLPGWFKDTLPAAPIDRLAVLRLDGDMYGSTIETLDALYSKVSPGGYIIVDDYFLPGCRKAVHDFRDQHAISDAIEDVDGAAAYWRKAG